MKLFSLSLSPKNSPKKSKALLPILIISASLVLRVHSDLMSSFGINSNWGFKDDSKGKTSGFKNLRSSINERIDRMNGIFEDHKRVQSNFFSNGIFDQITFGFRKNKMVKFI